MGVLFASPAHPPALCSLNLLYYFSWAALLADFFFSGLLGVVKKALAKRLVFIWDMACGVPFCALVVLQSGLFFFLP
ncbi:hypothetical protein BC939DRAFT_440989 [Gamsiella multidivaricata]|uniref:uncharacterized protein n=1 Tax=Gamsiella multidivaricata TaxID=101098 RepID=UPI00221F681A|nr:uncharacterized protein BC939DRAFT_440989 [Gamsiella multidivaricata]KAI7829526.1 hypothetical protein BC939DRAFT_440989 [Gamsiella multidivaricata]